MASQFTPVANAPFLYITGMPFSWGSTTTLTVGAGRCRDSSNTIDMVISSTLTLTKTVSGPLGIDTGTIAASTWYYVYVIGDSGAFNTPSIIYSLSQSGPTMPAGYDSYRLVGATLTDGSSNFLKFYSSGATSTRVIMWDVLKVVNATLTATSLTTISVATGVPPIAATEAYFWAGFTPNSAGNSATFRITGSAATTPLFTLVGNVASQVSSAQIKFLTQVSSSAASIDYLVSASGNLSLSVQGFEMSL